MFSKISEQQMHQVRWLLTSGWLFLIFSLLYDPISPWLTDPKRTWSPLRINPSVCVKVQGVCLEEKPYPIGAALFWGILVPAAIFVLLVFGHELWRRICPLSFMSQIPNALKWQRQKKRVDKKTGKTRYEIVKIKKDSWLGRNHLYLQFAWLYVGLCSRILFVNSDRLALSIWLLFTIAAAISVGYLYGGKSWCQYFCPMAPVQKIYAEPGGLLTSKAHTDEQAITQSMCRVVNADGKEQSTCVACQSPCIDIDSERSYWDDITQPNKKFLYYGYFGLVIGYFVYYYLYAGNWDYYFSGAWAHQENQLATLLSPGFYLFNKPIGIPKLVAVPLTLGFSTWFGYFLGRLLEKRYRPHLRRTQKSLSPEQIQHRIFTICTFIIFNIFFVFGGRPFIVLLPVAVQTLYNFLLVMLSTLWLIRTWRRSPEIYSRESLASRFRKQLGKLNLDISQSIDGLSLDDLNIHEVYVLAKVLPGFTKQKRLQAYKGVLREALKEGSVNTSSSLEILQQMRCELDISNEEHGTVLGELGVENPELLDPNKQRSRENLVRLTGYRKALERMLSLRQRQLSNKVGAKSITDLLQDKSTALRELRRQYSINPQEEEKILEGFDREAGLVRRADFLVKQLSELAERYHALNQPLLAKQGTVLTLLQATVQQKKRLLLTGLLEILESLSQRQQNDAPSKSSIRVENLVASEVMGKLRREEAMNVMSNLRTNQPTHFPLTLNPPHPLSSNWLTPTAPPPCTSTAPSIFIQVRDLNEALEATAATRIARSLSSLAPDVLREILEKQASEWHSRLTPDLVSLLSGGDMAPTSSLELEPETIASHLEALLLEPNPMIQAISLYILYQLDQEQGKEQARQLLESNQRVKALVRETAETLLSQKTKPNTPLAAFSTIEKLVYLFNSDFFGGMNSATLIELADRAQIRVYKVSEVVTEEGDTCRELLLLIEGEAQINFHHDNGEIIVKSLLPGEILDELEVLGHTQQAGTIVAKAATTRILAIPVDAFDDLLERDTEFARRVLEMESRRLQQLIQQNATGLTSPCITIK